MALQINLKGITNPETGVSWNITGPVIFYFSDRINCQQQSNEKGEGGWEGGREGKEEANYPITQSSMEGREYQ